MSKQEYSIFLASPGDVGPERDILRDTVAKLGSERMFRDCLALKLVAWDQPGMQVAMVATDTPQWAIENGLPRPSECDLVVAIFWARIGTPLPETYRKENGEGYLSGSEYELHDSLQGYRKKKSPVVWIYRNQNAPEVALDDTELDEKLAQLNGVKALFDQFENTDGSLPAGINYFENTEQFAEQFEQHLRDHLSALVQETGGSIQSRPDTALGLSNEALQLNRSAQWSGLINLINTEKHATVLLYGTTMQSMELFVARAWAYLQSESSREHTLIEVSAKRDLAYPTSAAEWVNRVRMALNDERTASEAIVSLLRNTPVLIILGRNPFELGEMEKREVKALGEFLSRSLKEIYEEIQQAPLARHPLRVLVTVSYNDCDSQVSELNALMDATYSDGEVSHRKLDEFQPVEWGHIASYLDKQDPVPPNSVYRRLKEMFVKLDTDEMSFEQLTGWLNKKLN